MHKLKRLTYLSVSVVLGLAASAQQADISSTVSTGPTASIQVKRAGGGTINGSVLLFDNGAWITQIGVGAGGADVSEIESGLSTFGLNMADGVARLADDFTNSGTDSWDLQTLTFRGYQTSAPTTGTFTGATVQIWDGPPNVGTSTVIAGDTTTNRYVSHVWSNVYRVTSTTLTSTARAVMDITVDLSFVGPLAPGTFWIDVSFMGTSTSGPWGNPTVPWDASDNGQQFFAGAWNVTTFGQGMAPVDYPYLLDGNVISGCTSDSLTTLFAGGNQGSIGGANYFDVKVKNAGGVTVTSLDVHCSTSTVAGTNFSVDVYTTPGTAVGNQTNMSVWTLVSQGNAVSNASPTPTPVDVSDFSLAAGDYGIAIVFTNAGLRYTNGTGTNQFFTNADLDLNLGSATNVPFSGTPFSPRVWNGTVYYDVGTNCCRAPSTYCTAQVNSQGCTPAISSVGTPSAVAGSGFVIDGTQVLPNVNGILAYSTTGNNASPFMGGTLCIRSPLTRTPVQNSAATGAPPCTGVFSIDFNTWITTGGDPALVAGAEVWAQYWSRDQGAAFGSSLSDALNFVICP
jgi:hypothetical protein